MADRIVEMGFEAPALRWEPCVAAHAGDAWGLCDGCGWPIAEHAGDDGHRDAIVIPVPVRERPRLRRAS